jgi:hypothetical protein
MIDNLEILIIAATIYDQNKMIFWQWVTIPHRILTKQHKFH